MYDEETEPTEEEYDKQETEAAVKGSPTVSITGLTREDIEAVIRGAVRNAMHIDVNDLARKMVKEAVENHLHSLVTELASAELTQEIRKAIAEGWDETDSWGNKRKHHTIRDRLSAFLDGKDDSYNRETRLQKAIKETVEAAVKNEFQKELELARKQFREQLDTVLNVKLRDTIAQAIGVKG